MYSDRLIIRLDKTLCVNEIKLSSNQLRKPATFLSRHFCSDPPWLEQIPQQLDQTKSIEICIIFPAISKESL